MHRPTPTEIIHLRDRAGLTWVAIGERYDVSEATARRWYRRAQEGVPLAGRPRGRPGGTTRLAERCVECGGEEVVARDLCGTCYQRARRAGFEAIPGKV